MPRGFRIAALIGVCCGLVAGNGLCALGLKGCGTVHRSPKSPMFCRASTTGLVQTTPGVASTTVGAFAVFFFTQGEGGLRMTHVLLALKSCGCCKASCILLSRRVDLVLQGSCLSGDNAAPFCEEGCKAGCFILRGAWNDGSVCLGSLGASVHDWSTASRISPLVPLQLPFSLPCVQTGGTRSTHVVPCLVLCGASYAGNSEQRRQRLRAMDSVQTSQLAVAFLTTTPQDFFGSAFKKLRDVHAKTFVSAGRMRQRSVGCRVLRRTRRAGEGEQHVKMAPQGLKTAEM